MQAEEYLQTGDLEKALATLTEEIRSNPSKVELRIFLFQLLSVLGQWDRAITQLNVAAEMDSDASLMAQVYRPALNCEVLRSNVFQGKRTPLIFGEPLEWMVWLTQVPGLLAAGNPKAAAELRDQAFEAAPAISGRIDGQAFTWIADADARLGPTLEAIINGKYYWIPFERIREIRIDKPVNLRDVIWATATFTWANQGQAVGLIPSRYPSSEEDEDSLFRMGRKTDWRDAGNDLFIGIGQRMLATDQGEYPLLEIREVFLNQSDSQPEENPRHG
ncbi:MAG: tetratricopeptide repeat protein [Desulfosarcina sp.]|nr:tetratricopeptide repeat protein [Desulfosarcina sp.]MBC2741652.1 tetratricopeptide repeat protein [Desulfosarcina sp.]MBC2764566.1 tetratricopeptide repeat protein [Desulfosarcina sp.]